MHALDANSLRSNADWEAEVLEARVVAHRKSARRWDLVSKISALVLTFTAGVSALSIFANHEWLAATFAIITAAVSALNAAFQPAESAKVNRDAATRYERLMPQLSDIQYVIQPNTTYNPETEQYEDGSISGNALAEAWREFRTIRITVQEISEAAPLVNWEAIYKKSQKKAEEYWKNEEEEQRRRMATPPVAGGSDRTGE